ncbi:MAG TPA: hypothetical protein VMT51_09295 [Dongiaceae bacterium]|nr:hypothetical protein [Dongiaceae bacterium]
MKSLSFWRGVAVALVLSLIGAVAFTALEPLVGPGFGLRGLIAALGFSYLLVLLHNTQAPVGRVVTVVIWLAVTALLFVGDPTLWLWLLVQVGMIWLVRCLYLYGSFLAALADAALNGLALAASLSTAQHTHSPFLTLWTFFLVQALYVLIPKLRASATQPETPADGFDQAYRTAEAALRRLPIRN